MSDLTGKFSVLEAELTEQAETAETTRGNIYALLGAMADTIEAMNNNNAVNTRLLLNAINQSSACSTCPTGPIIGTPPIDTSTPESDEFCQRVQAFLTFIALCCTYADGVGDLSAAFTTGFVTAVVDEIRGTMDDPGIPDPSWLDTLVLAADGVNFVINRAILGGSTHETFDPVRFDIQNAMFVSGSPEAAQQAYYDGIDAAEGLGASRPLLKGFAYGDVVNYFLDPSTEPNLTSFDGDVCAPPGCVDFLSQAVTLSCGGSSGIIVWDTPFVGINDNGASCTAPLGVWTNTTLNGYTITPTADVRFFSSAGGHVDINAGTSYVVDFETNHAAIVYLSGELPFTATLCPTPS